MKALIQRALRAGLDEYRINWIVASAAPSSAALPELRAVDAEVAKLIDASPTPKVRSALSYHRSGLPGWAIMVDGQVACVAHFADQPRYKHDSTWPLGANELCLVDIVTEDAQRGKGHAVQLIRAATEKYRAEGRDRLIAFIWWSNKPSSRSFAKAGWRRIGLSIEAKVAGRWLATRLPWLG